MPISVISPCKLNLFLYITGKRPDGYHNLQTLFVVLDYGDYMTFSKRNDDSFNLKGKFDFNIENNIIYKAWKILAESYNIGGIDISIEKILPMGGGLGGGSANAATTLLVLNHIYQLNLSEDILINIASSLGADVPIFIKGRTCFGEGIGEILKPVDYPECFYLVVTPDCKVPTKELFLSKELKKDSPKMDYNELINQKFENCFTPVVIRKYPQVKELLLELSQFGNAYMSGSGSSCFVSFKNRIEAENAMQKLKGHYSKMFVAKAVNKNQVLDALKTTN